MVVITYVRKLNNYKGCNQMDPFLYLWYFLNDIWGPTICVVIYLQSIETDVLLETGGPTPLLAVQV